VTHNPVKGVKRPKVESYEGKTPAIADAQARTLLSLPEAETIKGKRDRAILSTLLHHALRREELCALRVKDIHARRGVPHLRVRGKGGKTRYIPLHPGTQGLVTDYLEASGHGSEADGALYRPVRNNLTGELGEAVTPDGVYKAVRGYAKAMGVEIGAHALRATAAPRCKSGWGTPTCEGLVGPSQFGSSKGKSQELTVIGLDHSALLLIDRELEFARQESRNRHRPEVLELARGEHARAFALHHNRPLLSRRRGGCPALVPRLF